MIWPFRKKKKPEAVTAAPVEPKRKKISATVLAKASEKKPEAIRQFEPYQPPPGVIPSDKKVAALAMDETPYDYVNSAYINNHFPGYQYLAQLAQLPEYRKMAETIAEEMTRKWITLSSTGEDDKTDKLNKLEEALKRFKVRALFQKAAELDGFYGRGQIYIELDKPSGGVASEDPEELQAPLFIAPAKIKQGALKALRLIEPIWTYPGAYNAQNPLAPNYYKPSLWYVMGKTVHDSRMLTFVSRPVPDLLKASYNFGGLALSQMAQPYVQNWMRTRDSISDLIHSFSTSGLLTNLSTILSGGADEGIFDRADLFNKLRDNRGLMLLDKDTEEFFQFNTPLSGLDALQAQSQEHMSAVSGVPLVKLLGITPSGLNASSEGEIRVFYDHIAALQEKLFRDPLTKLLNIIQLSEFGEIDPDITFTFEPLYELNDPEKAQVRKTDAETDSVLIASGVIAPDESRARIAADPESGYNGLDLNVEIEEPDEEDDAPAMDEEQHWITAKGKHILINEEGEVIGGAGGKLNGMKLERAKSTTKKEPTEKPAAKKPEVKKAEPKKTEAKAEKSESFAPAPKKSTTNKFSESRGSKSDSVKKVFEGKSNADLEKIGNSLIARMDGKFEVTMTGVKYSSSEHAVEFEATDEDGDTYIKYTFTREDNGPVTMDFTTMTANNQSGGAKKAIADMLTTAIANKIGRITTHANMNVGGYAWAKTGYVPDQSSWDELRKYQLKQVENGKIEASDEAVELLKSSNPKSIWALSDHPDGKKLLLNTSWYGYIDLSDKEALHRAVSYSRK